MAAPAETRRLVLVTGAAGVMGARLVAGLVDRGFTVRALVLPADPQARRLAGPHVEIVEGDIRKPETLAPACAGVHTVFHLAAVIIAHDRAVFTSVNRDGTANVVAAAVAAGVQHLIYVSSASVTYPRLTLYGRSKLDAEELVRAAGLPFTIVRPTLVYDEAGGQEFRMFLAYLRRFPVVPFIGPGLAKKQPVFSGDVVAGLLAIAGNATTHGKTYNLSGGEAIGIAELARLMLSHHGGSRPFLHLPVWPCRAAAWLLRHLMADPPLSPYTIAAMLNDADLDHGAATADLGYRPLGVREGFARCFPATSPVVDSVVVVEPKPKGAAT
jgi:NADH dehydrogenase